METKHVLRLVLASPSDVERERQPLERIISEVNSRLRDSAIPVLWELSRYEVDAYPVQYGSPGTIGSSKHFPSLAMRSH
jgi:hypothetical protein